MAESADASTEPTPELRIPRACGTPGCETVFYVRAVADAACCPMCSPRREHYDLSA